MTDIGELVVRIKADAAQLEQEMRRVNGVVTKGAGEMGGALGSLKTQFKELLRLGFSRHQAGKMQQQLQ